MMKYLVLFAFTTLCLASSGLAQDSAGEPQSTYETPNAYPAAPATTVEPTPEPDEKRNAYYKRVRGLLWLEGIAGVSSYDPDRFGSLDLGDRPGLSSSPKLRGPEFGGMVGLGLGGLVFGAVYRQANYDAYKLMKVGLDVQGVFRYMPYVHPMIRIDVFYARTFDGSPYAMVDNASSNGGGFTLGGGIRVPIVRWVSFSATFDWSFIGLAMRGDLRDGTRVKDGITGQQFGGTFTLTFHLIGVRKE
jgi:hypothetical protein